ncbi:MAG: hypothetical protein JM58_14470 [Peptococcaceae bacterium BICA1-8]|nr:MAG: hypothetical protein JM58_14470 [Peptococcaceae bacterium BICA1-8]
MNFLKKLIRLVFGLFVFSIAIVLTIHSQLGATPWDVLHLGITNYSTLSLGQISQIVGIVVLLLCVLLGEIPGVATVLNMYLVGLFIDLIRDYNLIPLASSLGQQIFMLSLGLYLFGWGTYFYMGAGLGSGPRDGLMVGLLKKTKQPVWKIRAILETSVLVTGYFMGGLVGIGTFLAAFLIGVSIQHVYTLMKEDPAQIQHISIKDYYYSLFKKARFAKDNLKETL